MLSNEVTDPKQNMPRQLQLLKHANLKIKHKNRREGNIPRH